MTKIGNTRRNHSRRTVEEQRALMRAHTTLSVAIQNVLDDGGAVPCVARPALYQDPAALPTTAEGRRKLAVQRNMCAALCTTCPVLKACLVYADMSREQGMSLGAYVPDHDTVPAPRQTVAA